MTNRPAPVTRRPRACADLLAHYVYIGTNDLDAAERFLEEAEATFTRLTERPKMGRRWQVEDTRLTGLRAWPMAGGST